ncbi:MAG: radical SAM protein [Euryarchaeota archaeon]|nr:radical SAM protein [Euryarchaeota archaeon]MDE1837795.1 radical SAM protein [Euryarchaeota archaeon]MDE1882032.1 radical SAM protein [Euryarchaeota archaeon]MDE2046179.1 radical SAM protein [Thermoplasmata archaeon]
MKEFQAPRGLPRKTASVCPECIKVIPAVVREKEGRVVMEKTCRTHGYFWDVISNDVDFYLRMEVYAHDGVGYENPYYDKFKGCPDTCGMCTHHKSHTGLALMDLTNRCNLKCPVCFANANAAGYVYEPSREQIYFMLKTLREQKPVGAVAVQFSGGEPTLSPLFLDACNMAYQLGFKQIQVATNGIRMANEPGFAQASRNNHLHTLYLQFDGLDDEIYRKVRGVPLLKVKQRAIENARRTHSPQDELDAGKPDKPLSVVLVPTLVGGFNENQIMPTIDFALDNLDVVRGVNFQPVALTARIPDKDRFAMRFTQSDLVRILCNEGPFEKSDFFPVPSVAPISELVSIIHGEEKMTLTTHPGCGCATFAFVDSQRRITPLTRFMDVDGFFENVEQLIEKYREARFARVRSAIAGAQLMHNVSKYFDFSKAPEGINEKNVVKVIAGIFTEGSKDAVGKFAWRALYIGNMHFQDAYDYDIQRLMRCDIHYSVPDGRIIPFCSYNSGPIYRTEVEQKFSIPVGDFQKQKGMDKVKAKSLETMGVNGEVIVDAEYYRIRALKGQPGMSAA